MKEHTRNVLVGLFMIGAIGCLIVLVLLFSDTPILTQENYHIEFIYPDSGGIETGTKVHFKGKAIGAVSDVRFRKIPADGVIVVVKIPKQYDIPRTYRPEIHGSPLGGPWIGFKPAGHRFPAAETEGMFAKEGEPDRVVGLGYHPYSVLPGDLKDALAKTAAALSGLLEPPATGDDDDDDPPPDGTQPASRPANFATAVDRIARLAESIEKITGDAENQQNIKTALADLAKVARKANDAVDTLTARISEAAEEFKGVAASAKGMIKTAEDAVKSTTRAVTEDLAETLGKANDLIAKFAHDADELAKVLAGVRKATDDLAAGKGTVGRLLRDDELYRKMIDLLAGLQGSADELKALVIQWRKQGIKVKF